MNQASKDLNFYNFPKKLDENDYWRVIDLAVQDLKKNPDIEAGYLMGKNWLTGISDIDLMAVYKNKSRSFHQISPKSLSKEADYIFTHPYYHFSLDSFKNIYYILPSKYQLYHLFGQKVNFSNPEKDFSGNEYDRLKASFILDCLINKLLPSFYVFQKNIDVRRALLWLHSIVYSIIVSEEITGQKIETSFPEEIKGLRNNWFSEKREKNLKLLLECREDSLKIIPEIVKKLDIFFKNTFSLDGFSRGLRFNSPSFYLFGINDWDNNIFYKGSRINKVKIPFLNKTLKQYQFAVPSSFFSVFKIYGQFEGNYSRWFKQFLSSSVFDFKNESPAIAQRIKLFNQAPVAKDRKILHKTLLQYGFHTANIKKEILKVKILSLLK